MRQEIIKCDVCGVEKKSVNHWYIVGILGSNFRPDLFDGCLLVSIWKDYGMACGDKHVCGQDHAMVLISRWMDHGSFEDISQSDALKALGF